MTRLGLALKALGLCVTLVGVLAFASVAQAEPNAFWLVNGAKFTTLSPTVGAETDVAGMLLTELGGKFIHIPCSTIKLVGARLVEPLAQIVGKVLFHGCEFWELKTPGGPKVLLGACQPRVGANLGLIETLSLTGLIKLHEPKAGERVGSLEIKPTEAGGTLAHVILGEECAFGETLLVGGVFFAKDTAFTTNAVKHLLLELPALTKLTVNGTKPATIDGSAWVFLGGAHIGLTFSGQPG